MITIGSCTFNTPGKTCFKGFMLQDPFCQRATANIAQTHHQYFHGAKIILILIWMKVKIVFCMVWFVKGLNKGAYIFRRWALRFSEKGTGGIIILMDSVSKSILGAPSTIIFMGR
jgi:hypothetical protein